MKLRMKIIRDPHRDVDKQRIRVFGPAGGSIGRAPDRYWVLPDPKCHVSGHHCDVEYEDGAFWIRDVSRNGVFVNGSSAPLGFGRKIRVRDGDRLGLGSYEIYLTASDTADYGSPDGVQPAAAEGAPAERGAAREALPVGAVSAGESNAPKGSAQDEALRLARADEEISSESAGSTQVYDQRIAQASLGRIVKIDRDALRGTGLLPSQESERLIANQYRKIKRPLIVNAMGKGAVSAVPHGHMIMVTSALPGEGKTFCSVNLALSLAREKDLQVLLVDADVAKPNISTVFGVKDAPGLLNALLDTALSADSLVLPTDIERLSFLPAGRCELDAATELLSSSRMEEVANQMAARMGRLIVVFDSPPLLLTNESQVLAALMGQIVLVVRADQTPRPAVLDAIQLLGDSQPIGIVLNGSRVANVGRYYGYGDYGYGAQGNVSHGDPVPPNAG